MPDPAHSTLAAPGQPPTSPATAGAFPSVPRKLTRRERLRDELLNAPNLVTLARMACIPICMWLLAYETRRNSFIAAAVFSVAALSDVLDGYLARVSNKITTLGKFLDPLSDKLIVLSALVLLLRLGRVPTWVVVLTIARELIISGVRTLAVSEGLVLAASQGGKWKTSLQAVGIICLMLHYHYAIDYLFGTYVTDFHSVGVLLLYVSLVPSLLSAADYVRSYYTLDTGGHRG